MLGAYVWDKEDPVWRAFIDELGRRGYEEDKSVTFVERHCGEALEKLAPLAKELVSLKVDVIVTTAALAVPAAMSVTKTVPIVMFGSGDPVRAGWVTSLARPGGNVTGNAALADEVYVKQLEILIEALGKPKRIAFVIYEPFSQGVEMINVIPRLESVARVHWAQLKTFAVPNGRALDQAFSSMVQGGYEAVLLQNHATIGMDEGEVGPLLLKHRLPAIMYGRDYSVGGVLFTYGASLVDLYRKGAVYVAKILNGARPADLPVELPTRFEFIINLKTAAALKLQLPPSIVLRADELMK